MRTSYDCQIVGDDPAACLIATELAQQGFRTLLRCESLASTYDVEHWLIPATHETALAVRRWQLDDVVRTHQETQLRNLTVAGEESQLARQMVLVDAAEFRQRFRERAEHAGVDLLEGESPRPITATLTVGSASPSGSLSIWGQYRQVQHESLPTAIKFTSVTGARLWLLPLDAERTAVGACLEPSHRRAHDPRAAWEDELVACPALVQRLYDAELVGPLRVRHPATPTDNVSTTATSTYKPQSHTSPLDFSWDGLFEASETARQIAASLRQTPVY